MEPVLNTTTRAAKCSFTLLDGIILATGGVMGAAAWQQAFGYESLLRSTWVSDAGLACLLIGFGVLLAIPATIVAAWLTKRLRVASIGEWTCVLWAAVCLTALALLKPWEGSYTVYLLFGFYGLPVYFAMATVAWVAFWIAMAVLRQWSPAKGRRFRHWLGLGVVLLPSVGLLSCRFLGDRDGWIRYRWFETVARQRSVDAWADVLKHGIDARFGNGKGHTMLMSAATHNDVDAVLFLLENGADATRRSESGFTARHGAAGRGSLAIARLLAEHGCPLNGGSHPPLTAAVAGNHKDVVLWLIAGGADVNARNSVGDTPLHVAARCGCLEMVSLLLVRGANATVINARGQTPAGEAAMAREAAAVTLLGNHLATQPAPAATLPSGRNGP